MRKKKLHNRVIAAILWLFCLVMFFPMVFIITNSFKSFQDVVMYPVQWPASWKLVNFIDVWDKSNYGRVFLNTLLFAGISTAIVVFLSSMAGYKLARMNNQTSRIITLTFSVAMMLPFPVIMIPIATVATNLGITNNLWLISVLNAGFSCSLGVIMYMQTARSIPRELDESATIDGCSGYRLFFSVIFPVMSPVTGTLCVIYVIRCWNDLMLPLVLISKKKFYTIPLSQLSFYNQFTQNRWNLLLASGLMAILPVVILYIFTQKYIIQGMVDGALKG